jgi:hypothetical protein
LSIKRYKKEYEYTGSDGKEKKGFEWRKRIVLVDPKNPEKLSTIVVTYGKNHKKKEEYYILREYSYDNGKEIKRVSKKSKDTNVYLNVDNLSFIYGERSKTGLQNIFDIYNIHNAPSENIDKNVVISYKSKGKNVTYDVVNMEKPSKNNYGKYEVRLTTKRNDGIKQYIKFIPNKGLDTQGKFLLVEPYTTKEKGRDGKEKTVKKEKYKVLGFGNLTVSDKKDSRVGKVIDVSGTSSAEKLYTLSEKLDKIHQDVHSQSVEDIESYLLPDPKTTPVPEVVEC